jgi:hypothetical protein
MRKKRTKGSEFELTWKLSDAPDATRKNARPTSMDSLTGHWKLERSGWPQGTVPNPQSQVQLPSSPLDISTTSTCTASSSSSCSPSPLASNSTTQPTTPSAATLSAAAAAAAALASQPSPQLIAHLGSLNLNGASPDSSSTPSTSTSSSMSGRLSPSPFHCFVPGHNNNLNSSSTLSPSPMQYPTKSRSPPPPSTHLASTQHQQQSQLQSSEMLNVPSISNSPAGSRVRMRSISNPPQYNDSTQQQPNQSYNLTQPASDRSSPSPLSNTSTSSSSSSSSVSPYQRAISNTRDGFGRKRRRSPLENSVGAFGVDASGDSGFRDGRDDTRFLDAVQVAYRVSIVAIGTTVVDNLCSRNQPMAIADPDPVASILARRKTSSPIPVLADEPTPAASATTTTTAATAAPGLPSSIVVAASTASEPDDRQLGHPASEEGILQSDGRPAANQQPGIQSDMESESFGKHDRPIRPEPPKHPFVDVDLATTTTTTTTISGPEPVHVIPLPSLAFALQPAAATFVSFVAIDSAVADNSLGLSLGCFFFFGAFVVR